ncbi:MAG: GntR family transcriptional regulator [Peptostreptococcaceae bacterium]|nr:GntR family transcriptional regulator [Peptostreptococcaceae bacterium]
MNILISNSSGIPIYEQIYQQIKTLILMGELQEGEALPSMRLLAKELRISVITSKRAYEELEKSGLIYSITGKGSFVAPKNIELLREQHLREVEDLLKAAIKKSRTISLSLEEMDEMLSLLYDEED